MDNPNTNFPKYQGKKNRSRLLAASYRRLGASYGPVLREDMRERYAKMADLVAGCGSVLDFTADTGALYWANFCRQRLCPMCAWRRSLKLFGNLSAILDAYDEQDNDHKYLFFTVTVRNVPGEQLSAAIDQLMVGHHRMVNHRGWKRRVLGCYRGLEVTYNPQTDTYHPHLHYILAVRANYGSSTDPDYWAHEDWLHIWQVSAGLDYRPSVEIHRIRQRGDGKEAMSAAIAEVAKYIVSDEDYLAPMPLMVRDRSVDVLSRHLKGRRLASFNGIFSKIRKRLALDDEEDGDLTDGVIRQDLYILIRRYRWYNGSYRSEEILCYNDHTGRECTAESWQLDWESQQLSDKLP